MSEKPTILSGMSSDWQRGFDAGVVYILMAQGTPIIRCIASSASDEQFLLWAHQMSYSVYRRRLDDQRTRFEFVRNEFGDAELSGQLWRDE